MSSLLTCTKSAAEQQWDDTIGQTLPPIWIDFAGWWWWLRGHVRTETPPPTPDPTPIAIGILDGILEIVFGPGYPPITTAPPTSSSPADPEAIITVTGFAQIAAILEEGAEEAGYDLWKSE